MKFEVIVPESSRHLDRFFGASLRSSNASLYILPGRMIARYWSEQSAFTMMQEIMVTVTRPPLVPLASLRSAPAIEAMIPVQSTIPPNTIAEDK